MLSIWISYFGILQVKKKNKEKKPKVNNVEIKADKKSKRNDSIPKLPQVVRKRECMESTSLDERSSDCFIADDRSFDDDYKTSVSQERIDPNLSKARAVIAICNFSTV